MAKEPRIGTAAREILLALAIVWIPASLLAAELAPQPVSPGRTGGFGALASRCPTFHWVPASGAKELELVVYQVDEATRLAHSDTAEAAPRSALRVTLPGAAAGYTAPPGSCLARGKAYAWMLRATGGRASGSWTEPSFFSVAAEPSAGEIEDALEVLKAYRGEPGGDAASEPAPAARALPERRGAAPAARPARSDASPRAELRRGSPEDVRAESGSIIRQAAAAAAPSPTEDASLSLDGNLRLDADSNVFKDGSVLLWDDAANNTALGRDALSSNTTLGTNSTAVGAGALRNNLGQTDYGSSNTAIGAFALELNTTGDRNTAVGLRALRENLSGFFNTATGTYALQSNTGGFQNTAVGHAALRGNTGGQHNSALGSNALASNVGGDDNVAVGVGALQNNFNASENTAVGTNALFSNLDASDNTAVGFDALRAAVSAYGNTAVGSGALRYATGSLNTALGYGALHFNLSGHSNTAVGRNAALVNSLGTYNTALGLDALRANSTGNSNVAIGSGALRYLGSYNSTVGNNNIALGKDAGKYVGFNYTAGSANIHIGNVGVYNDSNLIRIGTSQTATYLAGVYTQSMSNGGNHPVWVDSAGKLGMEPPSSRRFKEDIRDLGDDSHAILELRPVAFRYKRRDGERAADTPEARPLQAGLIAEEVDEVLPSLVRRDANGDPLGVEYHELIPLLLNELQRQEREIAALREQVASLEPERRPVRDRPRKPARPPARR